MRPCPPLVRGQWTHGHKEATGAASPSHGLHANHCRAVDECLNETLFSTLHDARETLEEWQENYNWRRPHSALENLMPMAFLQRKTLDKMAA